MTKRHFEWAAAAVREEGACNRHGHDGGCNRCATLEAYVRLFRVFGPRFDEQRFRAACEPTVIGARRRYSDDGPAGSGQEDI
jgi:hypothetical protein